MCKIHCKWYVHQFCKNSFRVSYRVFQLNCELFKYPPVSNDLYCLSNPFFSLQTLCQSRTFALVSSFFYNSKIEVMQTLEGRERESWSGAGAINRPKRWQENSAAFTIRQEQGLSYWVRGELEQNMDWICSYSCDFLLCKALCNHTAHRKCVFPQVLALQTQRFNLLFHFLCTNCKHVVEDTCTQICWIQILCKHKFLSYIVTLSCYSDIAVYIMWYLI